MKNLIFKLTIEKPISIFLENILRDNMESGVGIAEMTTNIQREVKNEFADMEYKVGRGSSHIWIAPMSTNERVAIIYLEAK